MSITSSNHHFTTFGYVWRFGEIHADKLVLFLMTVVAVVKIHVILFEQVELKNYDEDMMNFLKYLINFFFYRFGLEICYITTAIVISLRLDILAVLYAIWLGLFLISSRRTIQRMWSFYILFHIIVFPLQYMSAVGLPPSLCFNYPWTTIHITSWSQLRLCFYLPDYLNPPQATKLIADFFQFLFACQQWNVFNYENNEKYEVYIEAGGSNDEIIYDDNAYKNDPTWNFVTNKRNLVDYLKYTIFMYGSFIALLIVYLAERTHIGLLGFGYLIACFLFLWYGEDFLTKKVPAMNRLWNYLIYYCFAVIFIKSCLQSHGKEEQLKLSQSDRKAASLAEPNEHVEVIRSGDYYMYDYESSEEEEDDDDDVEAIVTQEQILQVLTTTDKEAKAAITTQKSQTTSLIEPEDQKITTAPPSSSRRTAAIPVLPTLESSTSVESKEVKLKKKQKSILSRMCLIVWIAVDYLIDLFNRNSHDYREVLKTLAEIKSRDKIIQEECIRAKISAETALVLNTDEMVDGDHPNPPVNYRISSSIDLSQCSRFYRVFNSLLYYKVDVRASSEVYILFNKILHQIE